MKDGSRLYLRKWKFNRRYPLKSCVPHLKKRLMPIKDGSRLCLRKGKLNRRHHPLKSCVPHLKKRLKPMKDGSRVCLRKGKTTITSQVIWKARDLAQRRRRIGFPIKGLLIIHMNYWTDWTHAFSFLRVTSRINDTVIKNFSWEDNFILIIELRTAHCTRQFKDLHLYLLSNKPERSYLGSWMVWLIVQRQPTVLSFEAWNQAIWQLKMCKDQSLLAFSQRSSSNAFTGYRICFCFSKTHRTRCGSSNTSSRWRGGGFANTT